MPHQRGNGLFDLRAMNDPLFSVTSSPRSRISSAKRFLGSSAGAERTLTQRDSFERRK
jgi:hypothetical protein